MQRVKVKVEPTRSALATAKNNTSSRERLWDTALKFLCPGLFITSPDHLESVYDRFFLFARLNLPNVLISAAKKFFHSDFPFPCFDVPKASNFTSGRIQNRETKNRGLGTIVTSIQDSKPREKHISPTFSYFLINNALLYHFLAQNKKMTEKSVFREAWSPELTSQSFPVPCFWCRGFVPHRK